MSKRNIVKLFDTYGVLYVGTYEFLFDLDDLPLVKSRGWYRDNDGYLVSSYFYAGKRRFVRFHRKVMNAGNNEIVDHINKNRADNRKQNLRICEYSENDRNRGLCCTNKSGVTGVYFDKRRGKWAANITYNSRKIFLGRFDRKEDAVRIRLEKEIELFKEFAPQRATYERLYG